jgi:hypothetical protein
VGHDLIGVDDQFFFREELERAITLHIDRIPEITLSGRENGYDDPLFVIVGRLLYPLAYRKFGHREPLSESSGAIIRPNWLTHLKQTGLACRPLCGRGKPGKKKNEAGMACGDGRGYPA